jgi:hypothetical protein
VKLVEFEGYEHREWTVVRDLGTGKRAALVDTPHWVYATRAKCPSLNGGAAMVPFTAPH